MLTRIVDCFHERSQHPPLVEILARPSTSAVFSLLTNFGTWLMHVANRLHPQKQCSVIIQVGCQAYDGNLRKGPQYRTLADLNVDTLNVMTEFLDGIQDLKSLRQTSKALASYTAERLFREAHLFLHPGSFAKIERLAQYVKKLVVWLPIFDHPTRAVDYHAYMGSSEALQHIWLLHDTGSSPGHVQPDWDEPLKPSGHLGYHALASTYHRPCREINSNQWPKVNDVLLGTIRRLLPMLYEDTEIIIRKYEVPAVDFSAFEFWSERPDWLSD
ncbi:hypothetical protein MMC13_005303 [Lambiella insularis]|nr:hypothetical protein [Lambiella insularis]